MAALLVIPVRAAGEPVSVNIADQTKSATAGEDGKWSVQLDPLKVGNPLTLTIQGRNTVTIQDVLGRRGMGRPRAVEHNL